jgi:hypothetical protein
MGSEDFFDLSGQVLGGGSTEFVGDDDGSIAASKLH